MKKSIPDEDVSSIQKIYQNVDITQKELGELWQVSQPHISRILKGLRRKKDLIHVDCASNNHKFKQEFTGGPVTCNGTQIWP